jgi:FG-GAP-like repeat
VDAPPASLGGTPPYFPSLVRQTNCSLTRVIVDSTLTVQEQDPNYQDFLHTSMQIPTTADKFPNGCADSSTGVASQAGAIVGKLSNGNLAVAYLSSDGVQVFIVSTSYSILSQQDYPTGQGNPFGFVTGDVNGDGVPDMVVASEPNATTGALTVLLGSSNGTFTVGQSLSVTIPNVINTPFGVTIDDVNGDGKLDLIAITSATTTTTGLTVFLGNGTGTFPTTGISGPVGVGGAETVTADFNGDGKKDVATSYGQILLGNGDGTFQLTSTITQEGQQFSLAAADFNHDGKPDLAFSNELGSAVDVYLGNGDGTFTYASSYPSLYGNTSVEASDLDGDGFPDLSIGAADTGLFTVGQYTVGQFTNPLAQSMLNFVDGTFGKSRAYYRQLPEHIFSLSSRAASSWLCA